MFVFVYIRNKVNTNLFVCYLLFIRLDNKPVPKPETLFSKQINVVLCTAHCVSIGCLDSSFVRFSYNFIYRYSSFIIAKLI